MDIRNFHSEVRLWCTRPQCVLISQPHLSGPDTSPLSPSPGIALLIGPRGSLCKYLYTTYQRCAPSPGRQTPELTETRVLRRWLELSIAFLIGHLKELTRSRLHYTYGRLVGSFSANWTNMKLRLRIYVVGRFYLPCSVQILLNFSILKTIVGQVHLQGQ